MGSAIRTAAHPLLLTATVLAAEGMAGGAWAQCTGPWSFVGVAGPAAREQSAMVYDAARGKVFMYGGVDGNNFIVLDDAWSYTAAGYTSMAQGATTPGARNNFAMAYDGGRGRVVLFGGRLASAGGVVGDTWEWNGTAWSQVSSSGPPARQGHAMAYDSGRSRMVLFGGRDGGGTALADTWEFDGGTAAWAQRAPSVAPTGRDGHVMAYDASRSRTVLYGGQTDISGLSGDTWEWNGTNWAPFLGNGPPARYATAMVYDSGRSRMLLFGGAGEVFFNDTWERAGTAWAQVNLASSPQARYLHSMAYDSGRGVTVFFSGSNGAHDLGDTWEWRCGSACYANCDSSTVAPILNVADFICFLNRYSAADSYANCDGSSIPPILNVADFICFQNRYAAGCP